MVFGAGRLIAVKLLVAGSIVLPIGITVEDTYHQMPNTGPSAVYLLNEMVDMEYVFWGIPKEDDHGSL